jgi:hypothetical protein
MAIRVGLACGEFSRKGRMEVVLLPLLHFFCSLCYNPIGMYPYELALQADLGSKYSSHVLYLSAS